MNNEKLISFKTAKLADSNGFDWECDKVFLVGTELIVSAKNHIWECKCPTLSLLQKWLREVHLFDVWVSPTDSKEYQAFFI